MEIIETSIFTRQITDLMPDEEYREFQNTLAANPNAGKIIQKSGGLRKVRWAVKGHGKRGGARIVYFWFIQRSKILLLFAYPKNVQSDLTPPQLKALKTIIEGEYS